MTFRPCPLCHTQLMPTNDNPELGYQCGKCKNPQYNCHLNKEGAKIYEVIWFDKVLFIEFNFISDKIHITEIEEGHRDIKYNHIMSLNIGDISINISLARLKKIILFS
jgi:hypothetical protein